MKLLPGLCRVIGTQLPNNVVERSKAWAARFRRLARDDAQWAETLHSWHFVAFAILMLKRLVELIL